MECPNVKLIVTENRGRGLAATRNVSKGEELMVEPAAVVGPVQSDEICCVMCSRGICGKGFTISMCNINYLVDKLLIIS